MISTNSPSTSRNGMRRNTRSEASHRAKPPAVRRAASGAGIAKLVLVSAIEPALGLLKRWTGRPRSAPRTRSELVEVDAALDSLAPDLDLMVPANLVRDLVPAHLDTLGCFLRR